MKKVYLILAFGAFLLCAFHNVDRKPYKRLVARISSDTTLPDSYKNRKFISNDGGMDYGAASIPGNIVKYDSASSTYEIETMKAVIKGNKASVAQKPANAVVFNGTVTYTSSFNGSYLINGLKVEKNQVMDLDIRDNAVFSVPDGQIDTASIIAATQSLPADERKKLFYITSVTVSIISYNIHAPEGMESKLKKKVDRPDTIKNGYYVKILDSKTPPPYSASDSKSLKDKTISIVATPVDDFFSPVSIKK